MRLRPWLHRIVRNACLDELLADVDELPARKRFALVSHVVEGRAHADLAMRLGVSEGATKNLVDRARTTLAAARDARAA